MIWSMGKDWDIELLPEEYRTVQPLETHFLIVNGTLDSSTPPENLDTISNMYPNAQVVLLENFTHVGDIVSLQQEAFKRQATSYYDTGKADPSRYIPHQINFEANGGLPKTMKTMTYSIIGAAAALLVVGAFFLVRQFL